MGPFGLRWLAAGQPDESALLKPNRRTRPLAQLRRCQHTLRLTHLSSLTRDLVFPRWRLAISR